MANGHPRALKYTPLQAVSFYLLAAERINNNFKQQAIAIRMAVWADKDFEKWLNQR